METPPIKNAKKTLAEITLPGTDIPRYELDDTSLIGVGGYSKVFKARDLFLGEKEVAIKISRHLGDENQDKHYRQEAKVMHIGNHPSFLDVYDYFNPSGRPVLVMELADHSLVDVISDPDEKLGLSGSMKYLAPVCNALDYLHSLNDETGSFIVHRDIRPSKILITSEGKVKLSGLGRAGVSGTASTSSGTTIYRAPEGLTPSIRFFPESDLYSVGLITIELLTKENPFRSHANRLDAVQYKQERRGLVDWINNQGISPGIIGALLKATDPDYNNRFHSGSDYLSALRKSGNLTDGGMS